MDQSRKNEEIRVGIVGAGRNTVARHIPGLQALPGVRIVSVCNRHHESSERVAKQFAVTRIADTWRDVVEDSDVDAVVIGTWPYMHAPITLAALAADKHVLCEARMAMNAREAHRMAEAARTRPHLVTQVVPSPFTLRVDSMIQSLIAEGKLGDLTAVEVRACSGFADVEGEIHWRHQRVFSGLNVMSLGIWYEAIMRWIGTAMRVQAMGQTVVRMRCDPESGHRESVSIPDHLNVTADMACGAQLHMTVSSVAGLAGPQELLLFGTEGTLRFAEDRLQFGRRTDEGLSDLNIPPEKEGRWRVEEEFIGAIRGNEPVRLTTFEDGVRYMEFTEAVALSLQSGGTVALPLLGDDEA